MERRRHFLDYLTDSTMDEEALPLLPIVELAGDRRVLIENHGGISQYSCEKITVMVKFGAVHICGSKLTVEHMTRTRLVILGRIDAISLTRR